MANELVAGFNPGDFCSTAAGAPTGGLNQLNSPTPVGLGYGLGFPAGVVTSALIPFRVPNVAALATGLTVGLLYIDDPLNPSANKVAVFGFTVGPITSGTSPYDETALSGSTEVTASVTSATTAGALKSQDVAIAIANANSLAAGGWALLRVRRIGTSATETHKGKFVIAGLDVRNT